MRFFCATLLLVVSAVAFAKEPRPLSARQLQAIDTFIAIEMKRQRIPGLAIGIYRHGTVLLAQGYGLANVEHRVPVKPETIFQSGSVGKQFVAAAIMLLVEKGAVSLDDPIAKYFPEGPTEWQSIRVEHLMSHTSGLAEYETPGRSREGGPFYLRLDFTEDELARRVAALPIEAAPGAKWDYRNTNYLLLGILIHRVTGMPYGDFLARRIFEPLGMSSTRLISDADIVPNRAAGYELKDDVLKNQEWVSPTFNATADGTLYFNVLDMARWDDALNGTRLLRQASLDQLWTVFPLADGQPNSSGYGFGWFVGKQNEHRRIEHSGAWQGFTTDISRYPDDALTVVVLTNLDAGHARPVYFAHVIAGLVSRPLLPARLEPIDDAEPVVAMRLRDVLDRIASGDDLASLATPRLAEAATPANLTGARRQLAAVWPGASITLVGRLPAQVDDGTRRSLFRLAKGNRSLLVPVRLDAAGKFDSLMIVPDRDYQ